MNIIKNPSICIPRVHKDVTKSQILNVFNKLNFGKIERVDIIFKKNIKGEEYKQIFLHFKQWNDDENSSIVQQRLFNGKDIKIVYEFPWFWKVSLNKWDLHLHT